MTSAQDSNLEITPWLQPPTRKPFTSNGKMLLTKGKDDKPVLLAVPTGYPLTLHIVEIDTAVETLVELPCRAGTCYAMEIGCDNRIYLASDKGHLVSCDIQTGRPESLGDTPLTKLTWSSAASADGRLICFGDAAGSGEIACFDVQKQQFIWHMTDTPPDALYCRRLVALPDGRMAAGWLAGERSRLGLIDPNTGSYQIIDKPELNAMLISELFVWRDWLVCTDPKHPQIIMLRLDDLNDCHTVNLKGAVEDAGILVGGPVLLYVDRASGVIYELDDSFQWQGRCSTSLNTSWHGELADDSTVVVIDSEGIFRRINLNQGETITQQLNSTTNTALGIHALAYDGVGTIYYGHFINQRFGKVDVDSGEAVDLGRAVTSGGQIQDFLALNGDLYIASYGLAVLSRYDACKPAELGVNPLIVGRASDYQNRPMALETDGRRVFMATTANYGHLGGAISVYDPDNGSMKTYRHIVEDQQVTTVVYEPNSRLIAGGTFIHGEAHRPTQTQGAFFLWDPQTTERVHLEYPFDAEGLRVLGHDGQGRIAVWAWELPDYCVFDCAKREIIGTYQWSGAQMLATALSGDDSLWALSADGLFKWNLATGQLDLAAAPDQPGTPVWKLIELAHHEFVFASGNQVYRTKSL